MDDITRLHKLWIWARTKINLFQSWSLPLWKGIRTTIFVAGGEEIPLLAKQPIKALDGSYVTDREGKQSRNSSQMAWPGLTTIDLDK